MLAALAAGLVAMIGMGWFLLRSHQIGPSAAVPEEYQVRDEITGNVSDYMLNITNAEAIGLDAVDAWLARCDPSCNGFQWLQYSDPDSWDAFFYLPSVPERAGDLVNADISISVVKEGTRHILNIYLHTREDMGKEKTAEEQLLHFAAPMLGAWPSEARVYMGGEELSCDGVEAYD